MLSVVGDIITILVLGRSSSFGQGIAAEDSWPQVMGRAVEEELGLPVRVEVRRLNPDGRDPSAYLQRLVDELQPHVVVTTVTAYDFEVQRVANRVSELFGVRIARLASRIEERTRVGQSDSRPGFVNRWSRGVMQRFVGTAPMRTRAQVERTLNAMFGFLSRQEDIAVVIRGSSGGSSLMNERNPRYREISASFNADWKRRALRHHFYWSDGGPPLDVSDWAVDGVHWTAAGSAKRAASTTPAVVQAIRETALHGLRPRADAPSATRPAPAGRA